jgi:hypothetical protein
MSEYSENRMYPATEPDRQLIRDELAKLLKTVHFANSKRYPALLIYVVEQTLAGKSDELKERILGIEVFHRPSDYDTNSDTVVRVAAGEVRKRLALVYHESESEHPIHITLPAGSYVPEFFRSDSHQIPAPPVPIDPTFDQQTLQPLFNESIADAASTSFRTSQWKGWKSAALFTLMVLAVGVAFLLVHFWVSNRRTSVDLFWQPVRASLTPVIICPGALVRSANSPSGMVLAKRTDDYPFTSIATTVSLADVVKWFSINQTKFMVQPASTTTLVDMREHPVVLIAAYSNEWTGRIQNDLRYRFAPEPARQIYDAVKPSTTWMRPADLPLNEEDDFGVVARFHSKLTDNLVVLIAGIGKNATEAAAQFATTPRYLDLLNQQSKDWASKNVEVVLKVKVIDGKNGAPTVEAVYVW